jgi:hypothetical protein
LEIEFPDGRKNNGRGSRYKLSVLWGLVEKSGKWETLKYGVAEVYGLSLFPEDEWYDVTGSAACV